MIDSHSHIYAAEFDDDRDEVIARARAAGVSHIILPNENLESLPRLHAAAERYGSYVSLAIGLHPEEVRDDCDAILDTMEQMLAAEPRRYVAVGEIGIDLYWDATFRDRQKEALRRQLLWCNRYSLPFIIHCRKGLDDILDVMDHLGEPVPPGVFHCFGDTAADIERIRRRGDFYFGVGGTSTFKKSTVPTLLPIIGIDRILLETDAPYLAPVPKRGTRNESAFIPYINDHIAAVLGITPQEVSAITDRNATTLFHL